MALATEPTYSTIEQFRAYTPVSSQVATTENAWKPFALRAEKIVDVYVNISDDQKFVDGQGLKFPIKDDLGNSLIPDDITLATIEITSDLMIKGDPTAQNGMVETSESWDGAGYQVSKQKKSTTSSDDLKIEMPPLARRLLMPWTNKVARLKY